jgi:hypothetical protein
MVTREMQIEYSHDGQIKDIRESDSPGHSMLSAQFLHLRFQRIGIVTFIGSLISFLRVWFHFLFLFGAFVLQLV